MSDARRTPSRPAPWLAVDVLALLVFAAVGRSSHAEGLTVPGVLATAWPFVAGLVLGWVVAGAWRRPLSVWPSGTAAWLGALVGGMLLRRLAGEGTAWDFVAVATAFLALFLLGWRVVVSALLGRSTTRAGAAR